LAVACVAMAAAEKARYDNYQVYRVEANNEEQLKVLYELSQDSTVVSARTSQRRHLTTLERPNKHLTNIHRQLQEFLNDFLIVI